MEDSSGISSGDADALRAHFEVPGIRSPVTIVGAPV